MTLIAMLLVSTLSVAETDVLIYRGEINAERNASLFARAQAIAPERLRITSGGGEVKAGIALGRWVHDQNLTLVVEEYCLSSCANYVFPVAPHKRLLPGALVAWHGNYRHLLETGLWREDAAARMQKRGEDRATALVRARQFTEQLVSLENDGTGSISGVLHLQVPETALYTVHIQVFIVNASGCTETCATSDRFRHGATAPPQRGRESAGDRSRAHASAAPATCSATPWPAEPAQRQPLIGTHYHICLISGAPFTTNTASSS